jgi:uncharacterized integral membrane protein
MDLKTFRLIAIITVIVALILGVLALFNQQEVVCSLYGYQYQAALALIMFWAFLGGVLFAGTIGVILFINTGRKNSTLKKAIKEIKEIHEKE